MVLQRHPHSAIIWGFGKINSNVTLTLNDATYTTVVIASNGMICFAFYMYTKYFVLLNT